MNHRHTSTVADLAHTYIRSQILNGTLAPGTHLVTRRLALEVGCSLNPVREALGRLSAEGVVEHVPGAGAFVRAPSWTELDDLYDFREAIEPHAAARAARFITDVELQELRSICEKERAVALEIRASGVAFAAGPLLHQWIDIEERFHALIFESARNKFIQRAIAESRLISRLFVHHRNLDRLLSLQVASRTWLRHSRVTRAIEAGDRERSATLVKTMIHEGRKLVVGLIREDDA